MELPSGLLYWIGMFSIEEGAVWQSAQKNDGSNESARHKPGGDRDSKVIAENT